MAYFFMIGVLSLLYVSFLYWIYRRLGDIHAYPRKYREIRGWNCYKNSIWYERRIKRYGPGYFACLILGLPFFAAFLLGYYYLRVLLHHCFPEFIQGEAGSFFYLGLFACIFYWFPLFYFLLFYRNRAIFVAARLYIIPKEEWIYNGSYQMAWRNMFRWLFICTLLCFPLIVFGLVFSFSQ